MRTLDRALFDRVSRVFELCQAVANPLFIGFENIPDERPLLFVGNHTLYGALDIPFLLHELYMRRGILLRALGHRAHFKMPGWRDLIERLGGVEGSRDNCAALMRAGESILVFPGGAREVSKRRGEKYQLFWKERLGFARMAVEHGCTIVPFAAIGIEDAFDIVLDASDILKTPVGGLLKKLNVRDDMIFPFARGIGPTPIPRPERLYYAFGAPIATRHLAGRASDDAVCREVRAEVAATIERSIARLIEYRREDPMRPLLPRLGSVRPRRSSAATPA